MVLAVNNSLTSNQKYSVYARKKRSWVGGWSKPWKMESVQKASVYDEGENGQIISETPKVEYATHFGCVHSPLLGHIYDDGRLTERIMY